MESLKIIFRIKIKTLSIIIIILFLSSTTLHSQADSSNLYKWMPGVVLGANLSQVSLSNWTQGGESSFAFGFIGHFSLDYKTEKWLFDNNLKIAFGQSKTGSQEFRNTDNEIFMDNVLSHNVGWAVDPYLSSTLKSVLAVGYNYGNDPPVKISSFFDPGYLTQGLGITYQHLEGFSTRLGFGFKETFTNKYRQYSDDAQTENEIERFKFETGIEIVTKGSYKFNESLMAKSDLFLFSTFESPDVWDVRWDTSLIAKISNIFNFNINILVVYDADQSLKTQVKEAIQLGVTYKLL